MCCFECGATRESSPETSTGWRMIEIFGKRYYYCTNEFPARLVNHDAWVGIYEKIFAKVLRARKATGAPTYRLYVDCKRINTAGDPFESPFSQPSCSQPLRGSDMVAAS